MERQHGLNNQQRSLFRGHPNMNGEPSPVHTTVDAVTNKHQEEQKRKEEDDNK